VVGCSYSEIEMETNLPNIFIYFGRRDLSHNILEALHDLFQSATFHQLLLVILNKEQGELYHDVRTLNDGQVYKTDKKISIHFN